MRQILRRSRAVLVFGALLVVSATLDALDMYGNVVMFHLEDWGILALLREAALMALLLALFDWLVLPDYSLRDVLSGDALEDAPGAVRAAFVRGWLTFMAAVVIAVALISYT